MNTQDSSWLAGWLEGEGWFGLSRGSISIQVTSTDLDVVQRGQALMGATHIYNKKKVEETHKQAYTVRVTGASAEAVMHAILPHMGSRRSERIKELLLHRQGSFQRRSDATKRRWADPVFKARTSAAISQAKRA